MSFERLVFITNDQHLSDFYIRSCGVARVKEGKFSTASIFNSGGDTFGIDTPIYL